MDNDRVLEMAVHMLAPLIAEMKKANYHGNSLTYEDAVANELRRCYQIARKVANEL